MKLELHPDWKAIVAHAYSLRFAVLAAVAAAGEAIVQSVVSGVSISTIGLIAIAGLAGAAAYSRVVVQRNVTTKVPDGDDQP